MKVKSQNDDLKSLHISVVIGVGEGSTLLSAFDSALKNAGAHNYNLIRLSSIIPPNSTVSKVSMYPAQPNKFGHKLYVVMAEMKSERAGKFLTAGIGWYQFKDGSGFFVEHEIEGDTKIAVTSEINLRIGNSLKDMCECRGIKFDKKNVQSQVSIIQVSNKPACALALAIYQREGWV